MFNDANDVWKRLNTITLLWDSLRYILKEFLKRPLACGIVAYYVQALQKMLLPVCPFSGFPSCMSAWCMNPSAWMAIPYHPTVFPLAHKLCSSFHAAGANIGRCWRCTERCQELLEFQWVSIFLMYFVPLSWLNLIGILDKPLVPLVDVVRSYQAWWRLA